MPFDEVHPSIRTEDAHRGRQTIRFDALTRHNRYRDRANCESDQRHAFNLTSVAETPKFANTALRLVGSGWKLSGIYKKMSYGNLNGANVQSGSRTVTLGAVGSGGDGTAGLDRALIDIASHAPKTRA